MRQNSSRLIIDRLAIPPIFAMPQVGQVLPRKAIQKSFESGPSRIMQEPAGDSSTVDTVDGRRWNDGTWLFPGEREWLASGPRLYAVSSGMIPVVHTTLFAQCKLRLPSSKWYICSCLSAHGRLVCYAQIHIFDLPARSFSDACTTPPQAQA